MRGQPLIKSNATLFSPLPTLTELADGLGLGDALFGKSKNTPPSEIWFLRSIEVQRDCAYFLQQIKLT